MFRKAILALTLSLATPAFFATSAHAGYTKEELALEKDEAKYHKSVYKSVSKLAKKWHKAVDKDKKDKEKEIEKELKGYFKNELVDLKEKGITLKEEPEKGRMDPKRPLRLAPADDEEKPKLEALRDQVQKLKSGEWKDRKMGKELDAYVKTLEKRANRSMERYKKHKKNS